MRIVFFDNIKETYHSISGVEQFCASYEKLQGRMTKVWVIHKKDMSMEMLKYKEYSIERVEEN